MTSWSVSFSNTFFLGARQIPDQIRPIPQYIKSLVSCAGISTTSEAIFVTYTQRHRVMALDTQSRNCSLVFLDGLAQATCSNVPEIVTHLTLNIATCAQIYFVHLGNARLERLSLVQHCCFLSGYPGRPPGGHTSQNLPSKFQAKSEEQPLELAAATTPSFMRASVRDKGIPSRTLYLSSIVVHLSIRLCQC